MLKHFLGRQIPRLIYIGTGLFITESKSDPIRYFWVGSDILLGCLFCVTMRFTATRTRFGIFDDCYMFSIGKLISDIFKPAYALFVGSISLQRCVVTAKCHHIGWLDIKRYICLLAADLSFSTVQAVFPNCPLQSLVWHDDKICFGCFSTVCVP